MNKITITFILLIVMLLACAGCDSGTNSDGGGAGADFDESLYYTKAEIDALLEEQNTKIATRVVKFSGNALAIQTAAYANAQTLSFSGSYEDKDFAIVEIYNSTDATVNIIYGSSETSSNQFTGIPASSNMIICIPNSADGDMKVWVNTKNSGTITVQPLYYL